MKNIAILLKASILASGLVLAGGCATIEQLEEVRAIAERAASGTGGAVSSRTTGSSRQQSRQTRQGASKMARDAKKAADAAAACCRENSRRLDRMFEKAMQK